MDPQPPNPKAESSDETWRQIENLVGEIAALSRSELSAAEFYTELLDRVVSGLAASGGAVWTRRPGADPQCECRIDPADGALDEDHHHRQHHGQLVESVLQSNRSRLIPPRAGESGGDDGNRTPFLLVICPWSVDDELAGVVEVFQRPGTSPQAQRGYLQFLSVICELVTDFHRNCQVRGFRARVAQWGRFEQYVAHVHASLDLRETAYHIANEGRRLIDCDRVSVLTVRRRKCRLLATSGVATLNRRADVVRQLERLAADVTVYGEPLWHCHGSEDLPPQIQQSLDTYLDQTHVRLLAVVPLRVAQTEEDRGKSQPLGVLVVERFQGEDDEGLRGRVDAVCRHGTLALKNALELGSIPLARPLKLLGKASYLLRGRRLPKTLCAMFAVAAAVFALVTVPADFEVEARGELQPRDRRDVFAPSDGVVSSLQVVHAARVKSNDLLLTLRRPELDLEFQRIWGELQTTQQRLVAIEAERLQSRHETPEENRRFYRLTAEEEELKEWARSLQRQYEIVQEQKSVLEVRSPIDGQVLTWNIKTLLEARPVQQGQLLATVASLRGAWVLELEVPGDRIADVLAAQKEFGRRVDVSFVLATDPGVVYRGQLEDLAPRVEIGEAEESVVLATVSIAGEEIPDLMPGATVVGKIYCGRRSLGYVWLHDLIQTVRWWILF